LRTRIRERDYMDFNQDDPKTFGTNQTSVPSVNISEFTGKEIGEFVVKISSEIASAHLGQTKPLTDRELDISKVLGSYLASKIPNNEDYKKIASVYNGLNLSMNSVVSRFSSKDKIWYHTMTDEVGNVEVLYQTTGRVIPAVYGTFMGPNSPNNAPPVSLLDVFCAFHDQDYHKGGWFSTEGDYKLISRTAQNFFRLSNVEKPYARTTILYFSTAGYLMSALLGKPITATDTNSITKSISSPIENSLFSVVSPNSSVLHPDDFNIAKESFETELKNTFVEEHSNSSVISTNGTIYKKVLANDFNQIMIELL